ncbi:MULTISPECIES: 23S rRNA (uracil(1939)-C(5))-methyltransferase RlmD [Clostridia]|uniref:23S rRNA (uracil(1939)-C(5))-methyltransferase RlmD n=1 Tax=Clostridia TaxID=186801 RepID=UPI00156E5A28|nr:MULTISPECIES: 23S rRNA (uracil(1939)-C(5))-methyltransferase RlmD [Clostridia]MDB8781290.1 23S rRNA (uracil(1939)-C(5))-methyltransferase RlmD [Ruminococcus sp. 1001136sp1]MDB8788871.1 23S rRNA (uracil(1939)-C(5))-methyltransferase RlmD [Ruminococcus sp. 1001136sp1]NSD39720.1 23S rRNA (uracil(1939)-C(5))-methyltransferase RlmD [Blautia glucerasea]
MKKGEIYEGIIEKVDFPNKGYVNIDGEKVIVKNGIPGQKVRFMINKKRSGRAEGRLLEILENSTLEVREPVCKIFPACGGCMYQTMSYEEQLKMKETQVKGLLQEAVGIGTDLHWEGIHGSPIEFGYRNKMEFSFGDEYKDGPLSLGLHKKGSTYDVLTASDCKLVHPDMTAILSSVLDFFTELGAVHYKKMQHTGYLRHLLLRRGVTSGEILVHVITTNQAEYDYAPLVSRLLALPLEGKIVGIMHIINDSLSDVVQSDETRLLYGQDYFYETLLGLRFKISTFSFFQPNSLAAEVLYSIVRDYIGDTKDKEVFDLYSGTGTIAQLLASVAKEVIGVEIVEEAVEAAKVNAALNGLTNCRFIAGDVLKVLDNLTEKPDMIILDPPRDGIHPKALPKILAYGVENIVYISCKPTSLARDLPAFLAAGYEVQRSCSVDQFCETVHVETVVLLSKGEVDSKKIRVEFSLEDMDMSEFQDGATYTQIKDYVLEHSGLKVSNLYISQIKRKCGIEVGKNYNLPKSEDSRQPQCPPEKEKAIREAFKYFGMI